MYVGCLGDIVFQVSSERIETFNNMVWSGSARYAEHQRHLSDALSEYTGNDPETITIDIELSEYLGVKPMPEITKIVGYERTGQVVLLIIGSKPYGKYKWTVKSHKIKAKTHDKQGHLTSATVSVELLEYTK